VVLAMHAHRKACRPRERAPTSPADLAVPMSRRTDLEGFVLLGPRRDGEPYRADQVEQLAAAIHEIGLDFHTLRVDRLRDDVADLRRTADTLRAQLETAMALSRRS
jgi:hypothetical protein